MPGKIFITWESLSWNVDFSIINYVHCFHHIFLNVLLAQSVKPSTRRKKGIELGDIQNSIESIKQTQEEIKR